MNRKITFPLLAPLLALAAVVLLGGCTAERLTEKTWYGENPRTFFRYAAAEGPVWVDVRGDPFGVGAVETRERVVDILRGTGTLPADTELTAYPGQAGAPAYRVAIVLGAPAATSAREVCAATAGDDAVSDDTGGLRIEAALCHDARPFSAAAGVVPKAKAPKGRGQEGAGLDDPRLQALLQQIMRGLVPYRHEVCPDSQTC